MAVPNSGSIEVVLGCEWGQGKGDPPPRATRDVMEKCGCRWQK